MSKNSCVVHYQNIFIKNNMTGKKLPIVILSHFGQSITYHAVTEIETAHAELAEHFTNEGLSLTLQPEFSFSQVPMIFWWDNFDRFVDNLTGGGSIHNTPDIAFQEEVDGSVRRQDVSIVPSKRTSYLFNRPNLLRSQTSTPRKLRRSLTLRLLWYLAIVIRVIIDYFACGKYFEKLWKMTNCFLGSLVM